METLLLGTIGLLAGLVGGLLGVGGSIVMIPAMTEVLGPNQHLYQAAAMIVNFFVVLPAVYQHHRAGAVMIPVVRRMAPLAMVSVLLGVLLSESAIFVGKGQARLTVLFGVFLLFVAGRNLMRLFGGERHTAEEHTFDPNRDGWKAAFAAGLPTGLIGGLLGVGGGTVCVPMQNRFLGIPLRNAIANSTATILALSLIGAGMKNWALATEHPLIPVSDSIRLAATLIPTAMVGSFLGSKLTHTLPLRALRLAFAVFLLIAGGRMIWRGVADLRQKEKLVPGPPVVLYWELPTRVES